MVYRFKCEFKTATNLHTIEKNGFLTSKKDLALASIAINLHRSNLQCKGHLWMKLLQKICVVPER